MKLTRSRETATIEAEQAGDAETAQDSYDARMAEADALVERAQAAADEIVTHARASTTGIRDRAHRQAEEITAEARERAERTVAAAKEGAQAVIAAAHAEASNILAEARRHKEELPDEGQGTQAAGFVGHPTVAEDEQPADGVDGQVAHASTSPAASSPAASAGPVAERRESLPMQPGATPRRRGGRRPKVSKLAKRGDLDGLRAALHYEDPVVDRDGRTLDAGVGVRREAARSLLDLNHQGDLATVQSFAHAVGDPDPSVRETAAAGLASSLEPTATAALAETAARQPLEDPSGRVARKALVEQQRPGAVEAVTRTLLASPGADPSLLAAVIEAQSSDSGEQARAVGPLVEAVSGSEPHIRSRALELLAPLGELPVSALLIALPSAEDRAGIAAALGQTRAQRAGAALVSLLHDSEAEVRQAAAIGLGEVRSARFAEPLLATADDPDADVRQAAVEALDRLGVAGMMASIRLLPSGEKRPLRGLLGRTEPT